MIVVVVVFVDVKNVSRVFLLYFCY